MLRSEFRLEKLVARKFEHEIKEFVLFQKGIEH